MIPYLLVALGGSLGAMTRFAVGRGISSRWGSPLPLGTFLVNISGAFLFGVIHQIDLAGNALLFLGDGFFGAYTTFSTLLYEGFQLYNGKDKKEAFIYFITSLSLGLLGYMVGVAL